MLHIVFQIASPLASELVKNLVFCCDFCSQNMSCLAMVSNISQTKPFNEIFERSFNTFHGPQAS